jgi:hypothetical protein
MRDRLRGGWALFDAAQHGRELVDPVAALELPLVPPRRAGVDQRPEEVTSLGGVARADSPKDDLERAVAQPIRALPMDVRDQVANLIDRRSMAMPGVSNGATPSQRAARRIGARCGQNPPIQTGGWGR